MSLSDPHLYEEPPAAGDAAPLQADLELTLAEAVYGCRKPVQVDGHSLVLNLEAGTEDGSRLELDAGGRRVIAWISVLPHAHFRRVNGRLETIVDIDVATAALGGRVEVPSLRGNSDLVDIPEATADGFRLALADRDAVVRLRVPSRLTRRQKKILRQLERLGDEDAA